MNVSFDYDGTLSRKKVQEYAKELVNKGVNVFITTARWDSISKYSIEDKKEWQIENLPKAHEKLFKVAYEIGIPQRNIHFTNRQSKHHYLKYTDFVWHLDDEELELNRMSINNVETIGVLWDNSGSWKYDCNTLLNL